MPVTLRLRGLAAKSVSGRVLTADAMQAHNTFDAPDAVSPKPFAGAVFNGNGDGDEVSFTLPAKALVSLTFK